MTFLEKYGKWGLVTGASAGIGEEFAKQLAAKGLNLVLAARRVQKLEALKNQLVRGYGIEVRIVGLDLSEHGFLDTLVEGTSDLEIGLLVNNAGSAYFGALLDTPLERQLHTLDLNARTFLILTHYYGKQMKARGRGGIINMASSIAGFGAPTNANYTATKSYNRFLTEGLAFELRGSGVDVQALCPGGTLTEGSIREIGENPSAMIKSMMMLPKPVVRASLNALGKQTIVVPGVMNKFMLMMMTRLLPRQVATGMLAAMMTMLTGASRTVTENAAEPI